MASAAQERRGIRFGIFELDLVAGELRKNGSRIKLQEQPLQVLALLLERPGEVVTREDLIKKLWPDGTFVEFDRSLNIAVNKIREALGDSANSPRFVETVPRRGYRFIAPVERPAAETRAAVGPPDGKPDRRLTPLAWVAIVAGVVVIAGGVWYAASGRQPHRPAPRVLPLTSLPGQELYPTFSPDGNEVAFAWNGDKRDNFDIYRLLIGATEPLRLTDNPAEDFSPAWSPDGKMIAFKRLMDGGKTAVFLIPALGGPETKIAESDDERNYWHGSPRSASLAWTPDSKSLILSDRIAPSEPFGLFLLSIETREKQRLTAPPNDVWGDVGPAVSSDGATVAFCRTAGYSVSGLHVVSLLDALEARPASKLLTAAAGIAASPVWGPKRNEIVFTGGSMIERSLLSIAGTGAADPQPMTVGVDSDLLAISRDGARPPIAD